MRTKENQTKHDNGVIYWANELIQKGWPIVYADLPGKVKPPQIGNHIPDIYAKHINQEIVIEIETDDSVGLEHTKNQLLTFTVWKNQFSSRKFLIKIV